MFSRRGNSTLSNNSSTAPNLPASTVPVAAAMAPPSAFTIKLLHQDPTIKKFGDEYSFLQQCEDLMTNNSITSGADKMSFAHS